jgi:DNA-binding MarR family transcriptional regulator
LIRLIARNAGRNQQELAGQLGVRPSRLVVVLDGLQDAGLVQRTTDPDDHRRKTVAVTAEGREKLSELVGLAAIHEDYLCRALSTEQRHQLAELLAKIAADHGLAPGVHPGHADG